MSTLHVIERASVARHYERRWERYVGGTHDLLLEAMGALDTDPEQLLDLGCGTGLLLEKLRQRHPVARLHGLDPSAEMLAGARERFPAGEVALREGIATELPYADGSFDVVVSTSVLHAVLHPDLALDELYRVLRPGGRLLLVDWCRDFLSVKMILASLRLRRQGVPSALSQAEVRSLLADAGFRLEQLAARKIDRWWGLYTAVARRE